MLMNYRRAMLFLTASMYYVTSNIFELDLAMGQLDTLQLLMAICII